MQLCSWGESGSLGSLSISHISPRKLELLERRITGASNPPQPDSEGSRERPPDHHTQDSPVDDMVAERSVVAQPAHAVQQQHGTNEEPIYIPDTQEEAVLPSVLSPVMQQTAAAVGKRSPTPPAAEVPMSASKRRKTGKPQHRPVESPAAVTGADNRPGTPAPTASIGASIGAVKDSTPREKTGKPRTSPRVKFEGATAAVSGGEMATGNSNPPPSPPTTDRQGVPIKTPRSTSKQQQQPQHSKSQTKVNQFFAPVDGSSRDSDTPSGYQQHREQQPLQQYREPLQPLHLQQASPIEGLIDYRSPSLTPLSWPVAGTATVTPPKAADTPAAAQAKSSGKYSSCAAGSGSSDVASPGRSVLAMQQQLAAVEQKHQQELEQLQSGARQRETQLSDQLAVSQRQVEQMQNILQQLHHELAEAKIKADGHQQIVQDAVTNLIVQLAQQHSNLTRLQLGIESSSLGTMGVARTGALGFSEVWEDGPVLRELAARKAALQRAREEVDAARKALKKQLPPPPKATLTADASSNATHDAAGNPYISSEQYVMQDEILKVRLSVLRREEELLSRDEDRFQHEKLKHLRALKRLRDEECSRFQQQPTLHRRYVLVQLLGRGGFSEVHKAYDLHILKFVAIKIHQLNSTWSEQRKASYVKHSVREYQIHKRLRHPNIVSLTDIFEVDVSTFATVLELCEGGDLEGHLQQYGTLPERESRALIAQVFAGLAYLNGKRPAGREDDGPRVIHFDLKPANILFSSLGTVKITDFGLSKIVEDGQTMGMELTSQGAGTYWYLPPECFQTSSSSSGMGTSSRPGSAAGVSGLLPGGLLTGGASGTTQSLAGPKISNRVDVWSAGVILYQMLYGKRPFGEGLTQEQIYRDGVMLNARQVQFPAKPTISAEGKAFLSRCLAYNQEERWDVLTAAADPYLQLKR